MVNKIFVYLSQIKVMKKVIHREADRGQANHGWLTARHSFSFGGWYNPDKIQFGALRVLNDDIIAPATGFGEHPHDNMEIITIPLSGSLAHADSMGNGSTINAGKVQVMSAGTGVRHSEKNGSHSEETKLFQIWILPNKKNVEPRYAETAYNSEMMKNNFLQVVSPHPEENETWIHQNAWIHLAEIESGLSIDYQLKDTSNGIYFLVIEGAIEIENETLARRDAIGITEQESIHIKATEGAKILAIEVPMH